MYRAPLATVKTKLKRLTKQERGSVMYLSCAPSMHGTVRCPFHLCLSASFVSSFVGLSRMHLNRATKALPPNAVAIVVLFAVAFFYHAVTVLYTQ